MNEGDINSDYATQRTDGVDVSVDNNDHNVVIQGADDDKELNMNSSLTLEHIPGTQSNTETVLDTNLGVEVLPTASANENGADEATVDAEWEKSPNPGSQFARGFWNREWDRMENALSEKS